MDEDNNPTSMPLSVSPNERKTRDVKLVIGNCTVQPDFTDRDDWMEEVVQVGLHRGCEWNCGRDQGLRNQKWSLSWRCRGRAKHPGRIFGNSKGHLATANPSTPH